MFTPPWLLNLDQIPRPIIKSHPSSTIKYGSTFTVTYSGSVTRVSIMTPGSATHAVEYTQRMAWVTIKKKTANTLTLLSPPDATILMQGYHMLFLLNGDVPSEAVWIRLG
jgi:galactose oxidase